MAEDRANENYDVVVVGAGFAGLYMLKRLRDAGFRVLVVESAGDIGGTWYWNRYPGARCDIQSIDYSYSFDPELDEQWTWSEKYATQPEILAYMDFVATKHDLRSGIRFNTPVTAATWDDATARWSIETGGADPSTLTARHYVMATGCLSVPKDPDIAGYERYGGEQYYTGRWPHEGVDFTGKRVAVIGTGSSAIQSIPLIAEQAAHLTVFQRTPNFSIPAGNGPIPDYKREAFEADPVAYREEAKHTSIGVPEEPHEEPFAMLTAEQVTERLEEGYAKGSLFGILTVYADLLANPVANDAMREFLRGKIRSIVDDPEVAEKLCPKSFYFGTKRPCLDTGYYETFNRSNVRLVDLHETPIESITETGITIDAEGAPEAMTFDAIVFATGFDAMTGAIVGVDIAGRNGRTIKEKWADGPLTYLGLMTEGFPNLFLITGPQSPSVLSNMMVSIEQHVDWVADCLVAMRADGFDTIEPTITAEQGWVQHNNDWSSLTLHTLADSWYMGANVPGKPRVFLPFLGGCDRYRQACDDVVAQGWLGLARSSLDGGRELHDGVVRRVKPDVALMLDLMADAGMPPLESLPPEMAREVMTAIGAQSPPGPEVGETVDGTLPGAAGDLAYRLHRPATSGPHPIVVYFHGGGWVLGDVASDDPLCRFLCVEANTIVVSVDYRHAPEHRFPAAADDALAAVRWVADNAAELGGVPGALAVAGWSAGANLATVTAQQLRDSGGPEPVAQVLVCPVTDTGLAWPSYADNGEGYILTAGLMRYFFDHYVDEEDRADPRVAPLRAPDLSGLPPAVIATCEFDPLRDEGDAYAEALASAGVPVTHLQAAGLIHTSIPAVDMIVSANDVRSDIASALASLLAGATSRV